MTSITKMEEDIQKLWKKNRIPQKVRELRKNRKKYYFLDGPPYATGYIHLGTAWNKILKDTYIRFWRMQGFNVWDQPGYDTHGLPIENKVEEKLKFKSKADIDKFGVERFNKECREFATKFLDVMSGQFENLGVWMNWSKPYLTLTNDYIEGTWHTFKVAFEKGFLYKDVYSVHVCPRCVDLNSDILVEDSTRKIHELKSCWKHTNPIAFDTDNKKMRKSKFGGYVEYDNEDVFFIKTNSGREIISTPDHPFFVDQGRGWTNLEEIKEGDRVGIFPHVISSNEKRTNNRVFLDENDIKTLIETLEDEYSLDNEKSGYNGLNSVEKKKVKEFAREMRQRGFKFSEIINEISEKCGVKVSKSWISKILKEDPKHRFEFVIDELKKIGLLPLSYENEKLKFLARIMGHVFGDGSLVLSKRSERNFPSLTLFFSGKKEDLELIKQDIEKIDINNPQITSKRAESIVNQRNVVGTSTSMIVCSLPLPLLLATLGAPVGKKTSKDFEIPRWVMEGPISVKKEFLSSYFGSELHKIRPHRYKKSFEEPRFLLHKNKGFEEGGIKFAKQIYDILNSMGIKTNPIRHKELIVNSRKKVRITGEVKSSDDNLINFLTKVGYTYCEERDIMAKYAMAYLQMKKQKEKSLKKVKRDIIKLKNEGMKPREISKQLKTPYNYTRYVYYEYKDKKGIRASKYIPKFNEWLKDVTSNLNKNGIIWEEVVEKRYVGKRKVADVSVKGYHSFVVNGFITHNCETAVAYNEIEYTKLSEVSVFVKFPVKGKKNEFLLIWTTTPWTLPSNTGIMVKPSAHYAYVKVNDEVLIVGRPLVEDVMAKVGIKDYEITKVVLGEDLEGLEYKHPLSDIFEFHKCLKNAWRVVLSEQYVTLDEGTGLVHTAPGHGEEDYKVGKESGLPIVSPLNMDGTYDKTCGRFSGVFVKDADKDIIEEFKKRGLFFHQEQVAHDYPLCWRCKTPLLFMAVPQWFFRVTRIRDKLIEENKKVNWFPEWAGKRMHNWLESLGDWPISRQRYWGIPLPIWVCDRCEKIKVIGSREELAKIPRDFHRPYIDEVMIECECGGTMKRVPDVLDVWFDSGVASWATLDYSKGKNLWKELWPADLNIEGPDQIRGWWNSQLITSVITFDRAPYKNILFHGFILDAHGNKMSKSLGNIISPEEIVKKYGRDVFRFYLLSSPAWNDFYFNWADIENIDKTFNILRNTFEFVKTYVTEIPKKQLNLNVEDKWILSRLNSTIKACQKNLKKFHHHKAVEAIQDFVLNDFSRLYIKLVRDRTWPSYNGKDKQPAFYTLGIVVDGLVKMLAPMCPFISEEVYQEVIKPWKKGLESVHLYDYPEAEDKLVDKKLEKQMELVKEMIEASLAARQSTNLKLRWPVKGMFIVTKDKNVEASVRTLKSVLLRMCNVKSLKAVSKPPRGDFSKADFTKGEILLDLREDKKLIEERLYRELTREIQSLRKKNKFIVDDRISLTLKSDPYIEKTLKNFSDNLKKDVGASKLKIGKLEGKHESILEFDEKKIEIKFEKIKKQ